MGTRRFLGALVATNLKAAVASRGAFWMRAGMMFLNNFIFLVTWWVFFERYEEVRGWRMADMAAIYGVGAGAFGLAIALGGGVRDLAKAIFEGRLDAYLTQPKDVLLQSLASHSEAAGWGDVASAVVLLAVSGYVSPQTIPLCVVAVLAGAVVMLASGVLLQSAAFWLGDTHAASRQIWEYLIVFSVAPKTVFGGWIKVVLFTIVPAGFVTHLPVELVRGFAWPTLALVLLGAGGYAALALVVFRRGLRRYVS